MRFRNFGVLFFIFFLVSCCVLRVTPIFADCPPTDYDCQIGEIQRIIDALKPAHERNKAELAELKTQLADIQKKLDSISAKLKQLEKSILGREVDLAFQEELLATKVRSYYIESQRFSPLLLFLSSTSAQALTRELSFRQKAVNQDRLMIVQISSDLKKLKEDKATYQRNQASLSRLQKQVDERATFLAGEVKKVESAIASLTARQEQLLAEKFAGTNFPMSVGETEPTRPLDDRKVDPGFRPAFDLFTFGYPHRVCLSQFGMKGRALAGQDYKAILNVYYNNVRIEKRQISGGVISVNGYGTMNFENQYLLGIGEIPLNWPMEAQKAQAVAARSYAIAYTGNGSRPICTTQDCQVYVGHNRGGAWEQGVKATEGEVLVSNDTGEVVTAWYASTAGGYTLTSGEVWGKDRPWSKRLADLDGSGQAYDGPNHGDSPWFYVAWGKRAEYGNTAWLKSEEMADIINALLLYEKDNGLIIHLSQTDKSNPDTWNEQKVKEELASRGGPVFNQVADMSADWRGGFLTKSVTVTGDGGTKTIDGAVFKKIFNLRAPANIHLKTGFFNVEQLK